MHRDRQWRRFQRERKIANIRKWMEAHWHYGYASRTLEERRAELHEFALKRHGAPKCCSGWCCGNPRKHFGAVTVSECRYDIRCEEEYAENEIRWTHITRRKRW